MNPTPIKKENLTGVSELEAQKGSCKTLQMNPQQDIQCYICLNTINKNSFACKLKCGHCFHRVCLEVSVFVSNKCPICRRKINQGILKKIY